MSNTLVVILFTIGALLLFVIGMSLTLIIKGHNIKSEIGENEHMKARGIKCVVHEAHELEGTTAGDCGDLACGQTSCATCPTPEQQTE